MGARTGSYAWLFVRVRPSIQVVFRQPAIVYKCWRVTVTGKVSRRELQPADKK